MENLKTREWLFILFIVILIQFIVQACAWLYGGNTGALGYVSFAGTVISIILAVLAIVYSYVQSITQQSSANTISQQVDKLIEVTDEIRSSKIDFIKSLDRLTDVSLKIDGFFSSQKEIGKSVDDLHSKMDKVFFNTKENYSKESVPMSGASGPDDLKNKLLHTYDGTTLAVLLFYFGQNQGYTIPEIIKEFQEIVDGVEKEVEQPVANVFFGGALTASAQILRIMGLIKSEEDNKAYTLDSSLRQECEKYLEEFNPPKIENITPDILEEKDLKEIFVPYIREISLKGDGK